MKTSKKVIEVACKNYYGGNDEVVFKILPDRNVFDVRLKKTVVEEVFDPDYEISLEDAQKVLKRKAVNIDDKVAIPLDPKDLAELQSALREILFVRVSVQAKRARRFQSSRASSANSLQLLLKELTLRAVRQLSE